MITIVSHLAECILLSRAIQRGYLNLEMEIFFELMSQFDPVMQEHLRRIQTNELCDAYLSKHIHNELITILEKC